MLVQKGQYIEMSPHVREPKTVLDSGFHAVDSEFRVLDSENQKELDSIFFFGLNAFLRTLFSCSNLAILKEVVRRHNKFVLQNYGKKCFTVP